MVKIPDLGGFGDILKQAQELQSKLAQVQQDAQSKTVEASAGGGMVTAVVNGKHEIVELRIDPSVFESGDREMLQDLVIAAVNEGVRRAQAMMAEEMSALTGGLKIPGLGG
jgi:nucleoid-associated protein EbfC